MNNITASPTTPGHYCSARRLACWTLAGVGQVCVATGAIAILCGLTPVGGTALCAAGAALCGVGTVSTCAAIPFMVLKKSPSTNGDHEGENTEPPKRAQPNHYSTSTV